MEKTKQETMEILEKLPTVNSASAYGSGYFTQKDSTGEKKSMDIILSVDNPNNWHQQNLEQNPEMYTNSGINQLTNNKLKEKVKFPKSLGCFFTNYKNREYKFVVVDKRLLYKNLETWNHFSLPGRFQKEMALLIDNSNGMLPKLMKKNYESAIRTALLKNIENELTIEKLYETITSLSYLGDMRNIFHFEDPNKIKNIVKGSYEFFEDKYGESIEFERKNDYVIKDDRYYCYIQQTIDKLPDALKEYICHELYEDEIKSPIFVSSIINQYFITRNLIDSLLMAIRCNQTVGIKKASQTLAGKFKKGRQKIKK